MHDQNMLKTRSVFNLKTDLAKIDVLLIFFKRIFQHKKVYFIIKNHLVIYVINI